MEKIYNIFLRINNLFIRLQYLLYLMGLTKLGQREMRMDFFQKEMLFVIIWFIYFVAYFKETYDIPYEIKGNDTLEK